MPQEHDEGQTYRPTSGRLLGLLIVVAAAVVLVVAIIDPGVPRALVASAVLAAVLAWTAMLRPALCVTAEELVMRNMVGTVRIPLAAIEQLAVTQVLAVRAGNKRYVSPVVGKSWSKDVAAEHRGWTRQHDVRVSGVDYVDFVEQEIRRRMEKARAVAGVDLLTVEQELLARGIRREPAWLPITLLVLSTLALAAVLLA